MLATLQTSESLFRSWDDIRFHWIMLTLFLAWLAIVAVRVLSRWVTQKLPDRYRFRILPWVPVLRILIVFIAVLELIPLVIQPAAGNLLAVFGAAGVAIGFAFKDYVSSLIAGLVVVYEQPYRVGDWVTIGGDYGEVKAVGMRAVELVTPGDTVVTIPHAKVWDSPIHNANSGNREMQCVARYYVAPSHDGEKVRQKLLDVAVTSVYLHFERPVVVTASQLPWGAQYLIRAYPIDCREQFSLITDLTLRGNAALLRLGVTLVATPPISETENGLSDSRLA